MDEQSADVNRGDEARASNDPNVPGDDSDLWHLEAGSVDAESEGCGGGDGGDGGSGGSGGTGGTGDTSASGTTDTADTTDTTDTTDTQVAGTTVGLTADTFADA